MAKKGLDSFFLNYGITEDDLKIIDNVCQTDGIDEDWLKSEILAPYQERKITGANITTDNVKNIIRRALNQL